VDRLIVALDVSSRAEAVALIERLGDSVRFYKIGWQLFMSGEWRQLFDDLQGKSVFVDLKIPGDIGNTMKSVVDFCVERRIEFLTLSENVPAPAVQGLVRNRGKSEVPRFLSVLFLSSLDETDLTRIHGRGADEFDTFLVERARAALEAGCDGVIASGESIRLMRESFDKRITIVSPGIRPAGASTDDHKRMTTPEEAIRLGADYLVVGRPIRSAADPRAAARRILDEMDGAL
jgi:orotidine-5'-phosphate decarboxylase